MSALSPNLPEQKRALRAEMLARRLALAPDILNAFNRLADVFLAHVQLEPGAVVAAYLAFRGEMDTGPLVQRLRARNHPIALPLIPGRRQALSFRRHDPGDRLVTNAMGIQEPAPDAPVLLPDLILAPLLAFDRQRNRLGYGGGYYDRAIAQLRALKPVRAVGVGFGFQEVAHVPVGPHDAPLDMIVTENGVFQATDGQSCG